MTAGVEADVAEGLSTVAPDLLRLKLPLPFPPWDVNAWLFPGPDGWTLIDSGVHDAPTRALYERVLADRRLGGRPVDRLLVTHFHPDHVGLAGWLHARTGAEIHMSRVEWMQARLLLNEQADEVIPQIVSHFGRCGAPEAFLGFLKQRGVLYHKWVGPLPRRYHRLQEGDTVSLAGAAWRVMIGEGHAPEMVCLYSAERRILIVADQVLERISLHIGTHPSDPDADPLGVFLRSLEKFEALPEDTFVLPSHGEPFYGLHARITALRAHHAESLSKLLDFCAVPRTAMETLAVLFRPQPMDQYGFALSEALAHLQHLERLGKINRDLSGDQWTFARR